MPKTGHYRSPRKKKVQLSYMFLSSEKPRVRVFKLLPTTESLFTAFACRRNCSCSTPRVVHLLRVLHAWHWVLPNGMRGEACHRSKVFWHPVASKGYRIHSRVHRTSLGTPDSASWLRPCMLKEDDFEISATGADENTKCVATEEGQRFTAWNSKLHSNHRRPQT
jgi:hypothetical protein